MRKLIMFCGCILVLSACDEARLYEKNVDFKERYWLITEQPAFDFEIADASTPYNLFFTIRNESD